MLVWEQVEVCGKCYIFTADIPRVVTPLTAITTTSGKHAALVLHYYTFFRLSSQSLACDLYDDLPLHAGVEDDDNLGCPLIPQLRQLGFYWPN